MRTLTASEATESLHQLLDEQAASGKPVRITGRLGDAVLASEANWRALKETAHLTSIPGLANSIRTGLDTPLDECVDEA